MRAPTDVSLCTRITLSIEANSCDYHNYLMARLGGSGVANFVGLSFLQNGFGKKASHGFRVGFTFLHEPFVKWFAEAVVGT